MVGIDLIQKLETIPLSGQDLIEICTKLGNPDVMWMLYDDLSEIRSLDELFQGGINTVLLLLQIKHEDGIQSVGHWVALMDNKKSENVIYYDPYGLSINEDLQITNEPDLLSRLLSGKNVDINHFRHQNIKSEVNTCGRHTCLRSVFYFLSNKDYNDDIIMPPIKNKEVRDADIMISLITGLLSKSDEVVKKILTERISPERETERITRVRDSFRGIGGGVLG